MIDRTKFYNSVRQSIFRGAITEKQVQGTEAILNEWEAEKLTDLRFLAYMLATVFHETAATMQPISEYGKGKGRTYGVPDPVTHQTYYGRGFVQLTWKGNYEEMSKVTGTDLVNHPDKAMEMPIATKILFYGMIHGSFTGKKLSDYFNDHSDESPTDPKIKSSWYNARKIINGLDKADLISGYAKKFHEALQ